MRIVSFVLDGGLERMVDKEKEIIHICTGVEPTDQEVLTYCALKYFIEGMSDGRTKDAE